MAVPSKPINKEPTYPTTPDVTRMYHIGAGNDLYIPADVLGTTPYAFARIKLDLNYPGLTTFLAYVGTRAYATRAEVLAGGKTSGNRASCVYDYDPVLNTMHVEFVTSDAYGVIPISTSSNGLLVEWVTLDEMTAMGGNVARHEFPDTSYGGALSASMNLGSPDIYNMGVGEVWERGPSPNYPNGSIYFLDPNNHAYIISIDATFPLDTTNNPPVQPTFKILNTIQGNNNVRLFKVSGGTVTDMLHGSGGNNTTNPVTGYRRKHRNAFSFDVIIDDSSNVPATLEVGTIYTGATYDGATDKITFIDPKDLGKIIVADKPADFNLYSDGITIY